MKRTHKKARWLRSLVVVAIVGFAPAVGLAAPPDGSTVAEDQKKQRARSLFAEGRDAMLNKRYREAASLFARSYALYPAPTSALGRARALVEREELRAAHRAYRDATQAEVSNESSQPWRQAVRRAEIELAALTPKVPRLVVRIDGPDGARVELDGKPLDNSGSKPVMVEVGNHRLTVRAPGYQTVRRTFSATPSSSSELELVLVPIAPAPAPSGMSPQDVAGVALTALGGAGLVGWAVTGALVLNDRATVDDECRADGSGVQQCSTTGLDAASRGQALGVANTVLLFGGLASAAVGVTLLLTSPSPTAEAAVLVVVTPGGLTVGGRF